MHIPFRLHLSRKSFPLTLGLALIAATAGLGAQATPPAATSQVPASTFSDRIQGTVTVDGLAVPGATVTLTDAADGTTFKTTTDESGRFSATAAHPGEFEIAASMPAFALVKTAVTVPASGAAVAPVSLAMVLASRAPAPVAATEAAKTETPAARNGKGNPTTPARGSRPSAPPALLARNGGANGRGGRTAGRGGDQSGFQQLDINQTGDLSGDTNAGAADSGVAGMNDSAATDSAVVTGQASQDDRPLGADAIQQFLRDSGGPGGEGGPGGPGGGGPGGPGGPGGFGGGRGGAGGFGQRRFRHPESAQRRQPALLGDGHHAAEDPACLRRQGQDQHHPQFQRHPQRQPAQRKRAGSHRQ